METGIYILDGKPYFVEKHNEFADDFWMIDFGESPPHITLKTERSIKRIFRGIKPKKGRITYISDDEIFQVTKVKV